MKYFDHDTSASDDDAIMALRLEHGGAAVDAYWALLEKIYREERPLNLFGSQWETNAETKSVSHRLCIGCDTLKTYVETMIALKLLEGEPENLYSPRALMSINAYQQKAKIARQNGKKGGRKPTAKPKKNRIGSDVETDAKTNSIAIEKNRGIGFAKQNQYQYEGGAAAAGKPAAPPHDKCPSCGSGMMVTASFKGDKRLYLCPECMEEVWA